MFLINAFKQPYLGEDNGANLGGGVEPTPNIEPTPAPSGIEPASEPVKLKIKYNHEEKEITLEEARELAQKGLNYDKAEQRALDKFIEETYGESHGIKTYEQYQERLKEDAIRKQYENIEIPENIKEELVEGRKLKAEKEAKEEARLQKESKETFQAALKEATNKNDLQSFVDWFEIENERPFDPKKDIISQEVWDENIKGKSLVVAYKQHEKAKAKAEAEKEAKAKEANELNASSSPGKVTGSGNDVGHITFETFEAKKHDRRWVINNLSKINESRAKW